MSTIALDVIMPGTWGSSGSGRTLELNWRRLAITTQQHVSVHEVDVPSLFKKPIVQSGKPCVAEAAGRVCCLSRSGHCRRHSVSRRCIDDVCCLFFGGLQVSVDLLCREKLGAGQCSCSLFRRYRKVADP